MSPLPRWILQLFLLLSISSPVSASLEPRCGDCWCIYDGESDACPTNTTGVADNFDDAFSIYDSFEQTNDPILLTSASGNECFPFATSLGPVEKYPKSNLEACQMPDTSNEDSVCAYLYEKGTQCQGRNYEMITYESQDAAEAAGAVMTHQGTCGVCSNAHDLWARMKTIDTFESTTLVCATSYLFNPNTANRFDTLTDCAKEAGLTHECAVLWAHLGAASVSQCLSACDVDPVTKQTPTNGPAPQCETVDCLSCTALFNDEFASLSGRALVNSGITERTARQCSEFARIVHDPCVDAEATISPMPTSSPAPTPGSGGAGINSTRRFQKWMMVASLLVVLLFV